MSSGSKEVFFSPYPKCSIELDILYNHRTGYILSWTPRVYVMYIGPYIGRVFCVEEKHPKHFGANEGRTHYSDPLSGL